jgi:hypothetical protein
MWSATYSITATGIRAQDVWPIWSDISKRPLWDIDTQWASIEGPFTAGAIFYMKPIGGPKLKMTISECIPNQRFTDCYQFILAKLYGIHDMEETPAGLKITTTIKIVGPLHWLLRKIVGEKVVAELPAQTDALIELAKQNAQAREIA